MRISRAPVNCSSIVGLVAWLRWNGIPRSQIETTPSNLAFELRPKAARGCQISSNQRANLIAGPLACIDSRGSCASTLDLGAKPNSSRAYQTVVGPHKIWIGVSVVLLSAWLR
jgi:hypothetical protein